MEENKNNAVEKVEDTAREVQNKHGDKRAKLKASQKARRRAREIKRLQREKVRQERLANFEQARIEHKAIEAEKKVELAQIKAHKKAEREKAKATRARAKELKKMRLEEQRIQAKTERERHRQEQKSKRRKESKGYGGWLAAVISLGVVALVLASVLTFTMIMPSEEQNLLEDTYNKSFYETSTSVNNMDVNLSKVLASNDNVAIQGYLTDIAVESEVAENNIQQLPLPDENKFYTAKVINQIGDYAKYLNKKLAAGEELTRQDEEILINLYQANSSLQKSIQEIQSKSNGQIDFMAMANGSKSDYMTESFSKLQNLSVEYPELIYDGPFSDGQENREFKGISGEEITKSEAISKVQAVFNDYGIKSITSAGEVSGTLECINVTADSDKGAIFAQVSKKGGNIIMFSLAGECNLVEFGETHVTNTAKNFLERVGLVNMQPVWINLSGNVYTINFAYSINGVPVYSDLAKVRVCAETDTVLGLEAVGYYTNHTDRVLDKPLLTAVKAQESVSANIDVQTSRLAVIPVGTTKEKLCYEFMGDYDGSIYYVYIDAMTGRQVQMFKVIESTEGKLLI